MAIMDRKPTVTWGRVTLGEGMPKIIVPVMGGDLAAIRASAARAAQAGADIIELRIDSLSAMPAAEEAVAACRAVRDEAGEIPLLFTLRTERDGGAGSADAAAYEALLLSVAAAGCCEAIDCELSVGDEAFERVVRAAHASGVSVIGSSHAFEGLTDMRVAAGWLLHQRALGADVCKVAVMVRDELEALDASRAMLEAAKGLDAPVVAIAMGSAGVLSRIGAQSMGSCMTFGTAGEASAPGQIDARTLRVLLSAVHGALSAGE